MFLHFNNVSNILLSYWNKNNRRVATQKCLLCAFEWCSICGVLVIFSGYHSEDITSAPDNYYKRCMGHMCHKQLPRAWVFNYIPLYSVGI